MKRSRENDPSTAPVCPFNFYTARDHRLCPECGDSFASPQKRMEHQESVHGTDFYHCPDCTYRSSILVNVDTHRCRHHTHERPLPCPQCPKRFLTPGDLGRHLRSHSDARPFVCPFCQYGFSRKGNLKNHMQKQHSPRPQPFLHCPHSECRAFFTTIGGYSMHLNRLHESPLPPPPTKCGDKVPVAAVLATVVETR